MPYGGSSSSVKDISVVWYVGGTYNATTTTFNQSVTIYPNTLTSGQWIISGAAFNDIYANV